MTAGVPDLRPYQLGVVRAVCDSIFGGHGRSFSVMIARQAGKNELSAQLELIILTAFRRRGGTIVKTAPTLSPQLTVSRGRLIERLRGAGLRRSFVARDDTIGVGRAAITFLSAQADANVAGHTASLLLEVDEAHFVDSEKFERDFRPMTMSTGASVIFYGTAWAPDSLLERVKAHHLELEQADGVQRHFQYDWEAVARDFPEYRARAEKQLALLGPASPIWQSQYCLLAQESQGQLFSGEQIEGMRGEHPELPAASVPGPTRGAVEGRFVAGLDIGGQGEDAKRDPTVLTVARIEYGDAEFPRVELVKHLSWQANWDDIYAEIRPWHDFYDLRRICVDATGLGHHASGSLERYLGRSRVERLNFTPRSKSELLYLLVDSVAAGRVKVYREENHHSRQLWHQLAQARVERHHGGWSGFSVPERLGHDDYLVSLALCLRAAMDARPRIGVGISRG